MSRVDVPTLKCDRCKRTTQDTHEMVRFRQLTHYHMSGADKWDLCPERWSAWRAFINEEWL